MAAIPLLNEDRVYTAIEWNLIYAEADRKLSAVLDNKTWLMLPSTSGARAWMGKCFVWANGYRLYSAGLGFATSYDHQAFVDAVNDATIPTSIYDENKRIKVFGPIPDSYKTPLGLSEADLLLDHSLQAHMSGDGYWLLESLGIGVVNETPQKKYKFAVAELIFEGDGFESFQVEQNWNKFNFFRIHNCNAYQMTVTFAGGNHSIVVPKFGIKTVRRTSVETGYEDGYNYFWKCKSGDPRFFYSADVESPAGSMGANNVVSPTLLYTIFNAFHRYNGLGGLGTDYPRVWIDPHQLYDIGSLYSTKFPAVSDTAIVGDLLHHKGAFKLRDAATGIETDHTFDGYAKLKSNPPAGVTVSENPDGSLKLQTVDDIDLIATGTNLTGPIVKLQPGVTLDTHQPGIVGEVFSNASVDVGGIDVTQSEIHSYRFGNWAIDDTPSPSGDPMFYFSSRPTIAFAYDSLNTVWQNSVVRQKWHKVTVAQVKDLGWIGIAPTTFTGFISPAFTLTPFGLVLTFTRRHTLSRLSSGVFGFITTTFDLTAQDAELNGAQLSYPIAINFTGYGWPTSSAPAFLSPRHNRIYGVAPFYKTVGNTHVWRHPDIKDDPSASDGADFDRRVIKRGDKLTVEISRLAAVSYNPIDTMGIGHLYFRAIRSPDVLMDWLKNKNTPAWYATNRARLLTNSQLQSSEDIQFIVRMRVLREHYNALANYVNAIKKARPLTFSNVVWKFEGAGMSFPGDGSWTDGIVDTVRPAGHYVTLAQNGQTHRWAQSLGIQVKTQNHFPASWLAAKAAKASTLGLRYNVRRTWVTTGGQWEDDPIYYKVYVRTYEIRRTMELSFDVSTSEWQSILKLRTGKSGSETFLWLAIEDVKAYAEGLGFIFEHRDLSIGYEFRAHDFSAGAVTPPPDTTSVHTERYIGWYPTVPPDGVGGTVNYALQETPNLSMINANDRLFIEADSLSEVEFIRTAPTYCRVGPFASADVLRFRVSVDGMVATASCPECDAAADWLRQSEPSAELVGAATGFATRRNRMEFMPGSSLNLALAANGVWEASTHYRAGYVYRHYLSERTGLARNDKALLFPVPMVDHSTTAFSAQSDTHHLARVALGPEIYPLVLSAETGSVESQSLSSEVNMITSQQARELAIFHDYPLTL